MLERYQFKNGQKLRCGYTTGSCAAGAAKGAAKALLENRKISQVELMVPGGVLLSLPLEDMRIEENAVSCAVRKDAGDDKDVTDRILIYATVKKSRENGIRIDGGQGVGRVTKKGLNQPVGEAAINSVPRMMIRDAVQAVCEETGYEGGLSVLIEVPQGEELAQKTFNPRLGIVGGISILGTSGIVEPMSEQALLETIRTEISMKKAEGVKNLLVTPGNYGMDFVRGKTFFSSEHALKCSNFIGDTLDMALEAGFERFLLIGHIGKLVKLACGIMNTHSRYADGRMETLAACGIEAGIDMVLLQQILRCNTTDEALDLLQAADCLSDVMEVLISRIEKQMVQRVFNRMEVAAVVFSNQHGLLGKTSKADEMLESDKEFW